MSVDQRPEIENLLLEERVFPPDPAFTAQANAQAALYEEAARDPEAFWATIARETVTWNEPFKTTLEWDLPFAKWFVGGKLNMSENCVDRHVAARSRRQGRLPLDRRAGRHPDDHLRRPPPRGLRRPPTRSRELGIGTGDRVAIYMPMIPELPIAMLACARIGAPAHGRVRRLLGGGAERPDRRLPGEARHHRRRQLPARQGDAAQGRRRRGGRRQPDGRARPDRPPPRRRRRGRDGDHRRVATCGGTTSSTASPRTARPSRSTASTCSTCSTPRARPPSRRGSPTRPPATSSGRRYSHRQIFDIKPDDVYWCAADIGWVTGHSYIVYGPLANATTGILYEGSPDTPGWDRWWQIIEDYKVTILYCAPTAIRAFMKQGAEHPAAARPVVAARPRLGRRADQPRGLALVPRAHRRRHGADRRHVVADRDRPDPDHAAARRDDDEARQRDLPVPRASRPTSSTATASPSRTAAAATSS